MEKCTREDTPEVMLGSDFQSRAEMKNRFIVFFHQDKTVSGLFCLFGFKTYRPYLSGAQVFLIPHYFNVMFVCRVEDRLQGPMHARQAFCD